MILEKHISDTTFLNKYTEKLGYRVSVSDTKSVHTKLKKKTQIKGKEQPFYCCYVS